MVRVHFIIIYRQQYNWDLWMMIFIVPLIALNSEVWIWVLAVCFLRFNRIRGLIRMLPRVVLTISRERWFNSIQTPDRDTKKHISPPAIIRRWVVGSTIDTVTVVIMNLQIPTWQTLKSLSAVHGIRKSI